MNNDKKSTLFNIEVFLRERGDYRTALAIDAVLIDETKNDSDSTAAVKKLIQEAMKNAS